MAAFDVALVLEGEVGATGLGLFDVVVIGCEAGAGVYGVCGGDGRESCEEELHDVLIRGGGNWTVWWSIKDVDYEVWVFL